MPDIDTWEKWPRSLRDVIATVDVALLDGSFFSPAELPGRDVSLIGHPLVRDTAPHLAGLRADIRYIHLNHSNPLHRPGPERSWLEARGLKVGETGQMWAL